MKLLNIGDILCVRLDMSLLCTVTLQYEILRWYCSICISSIRCYSCQFMCTGCWFLRLPVFNRVSFLPLLASSSVLMWSLDRVPKLYQWNVLVIVESSEIEWYNSIPALKYGWLGLFKISPAFSSRNRDRERLAWTQRTLGRVNEKNETRLSLRPSHDT